MNTSEIASKACRIGGMQALQFFENREQLTVDLKGPQDYVSEADRLVEKTIITENVPPCSSLRQNTCVSL